MLRVFVFALAISGLFLASDEPDGTGAGGAELQADANCSGEVDTVDALAILRHSAGLSAAACEHLADVQCDGDIDTIDALQVLRWGAALAVSQEPGCTPIGDATGPPPTSFDLIEEAVLDGEIDEETGLVYQFYAGFNDPRLPQEYAGDDSGVPELPFRSKVAEMWPGLSQGARDLILPFMRTPPEPDSWYSQNTARVGSAGIEWESVPSVSHPVKVWWETRFPADEARANTFADAIDSDIWERLTDLMGYVPLPDCGAGCPSGGGDPRLDIYLVGPSVDANYTWWNPPGTPTCETTPAYITLLPGVSVATLAHEFMHVLQFALPYANGNGCKDLWWWEATGIWAKDYVYGRHYFYERHDWAEVFLQFPDLSLEDGFLHRYYGAYLFPSYLHRVRGKPDLVPRIFARMGSEPDVFKAIESEVSAELGDFGELWKDFTLKNWNQDPVTDYLNLDGLKTGARPSERQIGVGQIEIDDAGVEHLAAVYEKFTFSSDVHTVVFRNTLAGVEHAGVMAIQQVDGEWQDPEDWSDEGEKEFCFDRPSEKLTELIIIFSNSDAIGRQKLAPSNLPTIEGKADGCSGWEGSVSVEGIGGYGGRGIYTAATQAIRFEQSEDFPTVFNLVAGEVHWTLSGFGYKDCAISGQLDYDLSSGVGKEVFGGNLVIDTFDDSLYSVSIYGGDPDAMEVWVCPPPVEEWSGEWNWFAPIHLIGDGSESRDLPLTGNPGSRVAAGEYTLKDDGGFDQVTYRWRFQEYGTSE